MLDVALIGMLAARDGLIGPSDALLLEGILQPEEGKQDVLPPEQYAALKAQVQEVVRQQFRLEETARSRDPVVRSKFKTIALNCMRNAGIAVNEADVPILVQKLFDDILGYGVLEKYFFDPEVTEIIINGTEIRVMKGGRRTLVEERFESVEQVRQVLERMLAPTGRRLDNASPRVNARLFDGSRLYAAIAPVAVDGVTATIRRFPAVISPDALIRFGTASYELMEFLRACVVSRQNIVISGGTGSGKTTLINALGSFIPHDESVVTVEDTAELQIQHPDVRRLEGRPKNVEGEGEVTLRDLVADALRMLPDRIVVGECRRGEAFDMLQAMNTGHLGSFTTIHANSAWHAVNRLLALVQMADMGLEPDAIYDQIAEAVDIIIHISRNKQTGRRVIMHVCEVEGPEKGPDGKTRGVRLNKIWEYDPARQTWVWAAKRFLRERKLIEDGGWKCLR